MKFIVKVRKIECAEVEINARDEAQAKSLALDKALAENQWWDYPTVAVEATRARNPYLDAVRLHGDDWAIGFPYESRMSHHRNREYPKTPSQRDDLIMYMATKYGKRARHWQCEAVVSFEELTLI